MPISGAIDMPRRFHAAPAASAAVLLPPFPDFSPRSGAPAAGGMTPRSALMPR